MKQKSYLILLISVIIFISLLLLFEFNYAESIDIFGKNMKDIFAEIYEFVCAELVRLDSHPRQIAAYGTF